MKTKTKAINKRTGKPFNDHSNHFIDWTDKRLKDVAEDAHETMRLSRLGVGCHGVGDVIRLNGTLDELEARGYEVGEDSNLCITKGDEDEE